MGVCCGTAGFWCSPHGRAIRVGMPEADFPVTELHALDTDNPERLAALDSTPSVGGFASALSPPAIVFSKESLIIKSTNQSYGLRQGRNRKRFIIRTNTAMSGGDELFRQSGRVDAQKTTDALRTIRNYVKTSQVFL